MSPNSRSVGFIEVYAFGTAHDEQGENRSWVGKPMIQDKRDG